MSSPDTNRRPLKSRETSWAKSIASALTRSGIHPNTISLASIAFAIQGSAALLTTRYVDPLPAILFYLLTIVGIQGRLLCNLFDGMVAVEGGKKTPTGDLYNELPDRVADTLFLLAAGYAGGTSLSITLGWLASLLAMLTANVRVLGRSAGAGMHFSGLMAKQKRMATLTVACLVAPLLHLTHLAAPSLVLSVTLGIIAAGCIVTVFQRLSLICRDLNANAASRNKEAAP